MEQSNDKLVESLADSFGQAWASEQFPDIRRFLPPKESGAELRRSTLVELVAIDLERRWTADAPPSESNLPAKPKLEDYVAAFDELKPLESLPASLVCEEYRLRTKCGDYPTRVEYEKRFGERSDRVLEAISKLDSDTTIEYAGAAPVRRPDPHSLADTDPPHTIDTSPDSPRPKILSKNVDESNFGDYVIEEEIARGGMGVVFKARQTKANRVVALKMILSGELASEAEVQRFYTEAEAAANLQHPNIVPIYDVGESNGRHYFSMRFVDGPSLRDRAAENPLPPRLAASITESLASAVHYAHEQGVVHRDLKPANILMDSDEAPCITDFGLAKQLHADSGMTATGQVMGTPSYMPPEQALGQTDKIGPLSDVYSLGAILYELLTGRPPFRAATAMETLAQVIDSDPVAPKQLNPLIDRDLETVCLKCLQKNPAERYVSARELEQELERYLNGESVHARPVGPVKRASRWCRRRPVAALAIFATSALLLTLIIGGPVVALRESRLTGIATERANEVQRALDETQRTIDRYVDTVKRDELFRDPRFRPLLRELLNDALDNYKRFADRNRYLPQRQADVIDALRRVADIQNTLGEFGEGARTAETLITLMIEHIQTNDTAACRLLLANDYSNLGSGYREMGRQIEALQAFGRGIEIARAERTGNLAAEADSTLCVLLVNRAVILEIRRDLRGATADLQEVLDARERLVIEPSEDTVRTELALGKALNMMGLALQVQGRHEEALEYLEHARELREKPQIKGVFSRLALVETEICIAQSWVAQRRYDEAAQLLNGILPYVEELAEDNPNVFEAQVNLARLLGQLAAAHQYTDLDEALQFSKRSTTVIKAVADAAPDAARYQQNLVKTLKGLSSIQLRRGDWSDVLTTNELLLTAKLEIGERMIRDEVDVAMARTQIAVAKVMMNQGDGLEGEFKSVLDDLNRFKEIDSLELGVTPGSIEVTLGDALYSQSLLVMKEDPAAATRILEGAAKLFTDLIERFPDDIAHKRRLAGVLNNLGGLMYQSGQRDEGAKLFRRSIELQEGYILADPGDRFVRRRLSDAYYNLYILTKGAEGLRAALEPLGGAIRLTKDLAPDQRDAALTQSYLRALSTRAKLYEQLNDPIEASADWADVITTSGPVAARGALGSVDTMFEQGGRSRAVGLALGAIETLDPSPEQLLLAARLCSSCASHMKRTIKDETKRKAVVTHYVQAAITVLRRAKTDGALQELPADVWTSDDWNALRNADDWKTLGLPVQEDKPAP